MAPAVMGMANMSTIFRLVDMSWGSILDSSFGYRANARTEEWPMILAMIWPAR